MKKVLFLFLFLTTSMLSCNGNKKYGCDGILYQGVVGFDHRINRSTITFGFTFEGGGAMVIDSIATSVSQPEQLDCKCRKLVCFDYVKTDSFIVVDTLEYAFRKIILTEMFETEY